MRLLRVGEPGAEGPACERDGRYFMVLHPGDLVNTGTPAGVALGRPGTPYLGAGDVVELEIDGLGRQRQVVGQA
jgi:2-keto-4-pentenoate hydratase/2-oxohepta-3-ene-1,7-dioic acid hydratase in catechol pathway